MDEAVQYLQNSSAPFDKLFSGSSFEFFNLRYYLSQYYPNGPKPLLYSGGLRQVSDLPHYAGTALLTDSDLLPDFNAGAKPGEKVWLIWTNGFGGSKPQTPANWLKLSEQSSPKSAPM